MTSQAVNLDNLREMTGGDPDLEKELFTVYLDSAEICLNALRESCGAGAEETWRTQAHAWKGMSLNLGADLLGKLCAEAQMGNTAPEDKKRELLQSIEAAYAEVKTFLQAQIAGS
jgi:HPt (histidine-containing phosphotransfer) domain-containing protein